MDNMNDKEVTQLIQELKIVTLENTKYIEKCNNLLRKAADVIESLQNTIKTIDYKALECANLLETHFQNQEELERSRQQQNDYGEEIK